VIERTPVIRYSRRRAAIVLAGTTAAALAVTGLTGYPAHAVTTTAGANQVQNGTFDSGTDPWWWTGNTPTSVVNGQLCGTVPGATTNPWDAIIGQNDIPLINGESYTLSFDASASAPVSVRANVQLSDAPFTAEISQPVGLTPTAQSFSYTFTSATDTARGQVAFQVGGSANPWTLCVDNVALIGGVAPPVYQPDTGPRVRVNQVGYLPQGPKNATVVTDATQPLDWQLHNAANAVVASGQSTPRGVDEASNQNVQDIDFSSYTVAGDGYTLSADGQTSFPFSISGNVYQNLRSDALQFFYIQRSGIAIDGSLVGPAYARPAGHVGVAPNQGDTSVPCQAGVCDYRLDVSGGWYDAGDHGKYVVNGGIATYQLLSQYERTKNAASAARGALEDSTLRVPERGNKVPDVLDEARWELEFLLRMQVPAGQPLAGMAHHKIHDQNWTGLPLAPTADPQPRELHPPSTAATLNLAATAAQCARLYAPYDAAFAQKCQTAATTAWAAAKAHPAVYASGTDGNGGGTYDDSNVSDEFYWAAAELYLTTGEQQYLDAVTTSPVHTADVFTSTGFGWQSVGALGRLDLATVPSRLPKAVREQVRTSVVTAANAYLQSLRAQAYGLPLPGASSFYFWGSNSNILNNVVVLATAYDMTGDLSYRDGAMQGVDYIFGRNALNHSYVTGYGEKSPQNQHSRIYGHELDASLPNPPAGSLAGGANSGLQDPFAAKLLKGCVGQFCYVDDIQSYSTNEVAINWNSALSWVASFLADQGTGQPTAPAACKVRYEAHGGSHGVFAAEVTVTNTGRQAINGWQLAWAFTGAQQVTRASDAKLGQTGATVTATGRGEGRRIGPGRSASFEFVATTSGANPAPELFTLNGAPCG
jgi:endoglucanase